MINHVRTLLMNVAPADFSSAYVFEEIIAPDYTVRTLPSYLVDLRRIIFGETPDRTMLNYRTRQLLCLLANSELQQFVTDLDPRITYDLSDIPTETFRPVVTPVNGTTAEAFLMEAPFDSSKTGQMLHEWSLYINGMSVEVTKTNPYTKVTLPVTYANSLSDPVPLVLSPLGLSMTDTEQPNFWNVRYFALPSKDLGQILADIDIMGESALIELFGIGTPLGETEPFKTFYNLWRTNPFTPYRLGAVVLAMAYQTNRILA